MRSTSRCGRSVLPCTRKLLISKRGAAGAGLGCASAGGIQTSNRLATHGKQRTGTSLPLSLSFLLRGIIYALLHTHKRSNSRESEGRLEVAVDVVRAAVHVVEGAGPAEDARAVRNAEPDISFPPDVHVQRGVHVEKKVRGVAAALGLVARLGGRD